MQPQKTEQKIVQVGHQSLSILGKTQEGGHVDLILITTYTFIKSENIRIIIKFQSIQSIAFINSKHIAFKNLCLRTP